MLDDRRQRYLERRGNVAHRQCIRPRQAVEDRSPCRIGKRPKGAIERTVSIVNHVVDYRREAHLVKLRAGASHTIEVCGSHSPIPPAPTGAAKAALRVVPLRGNAPL